MASATSGSNLRNVTSSDDLLPDTGNPGGLLIAIMSSIEKYVSYITDIYQGGKKTNSSST